MQAFPSLMQLDIFDHSRDTQLRNDLAAALLRADVRTSNAAWTTLSQEYPEDDTLSAAALLIRALEQGTDTFFACHEDVAAARRVVETELAPAALRVLGASDGAQWLVPLWRTLAQRAARLPLDPKRSADHAAPLWLRAGHWAEASAAVARIESWRRIPVPVSWMAQARYHLHDLDPTWDLLAELAWLSPQRLDWLMQAIADPLLSKLRERFDAGFEGDGGVEDLAWFPAWLLTEKPSLAPHLAKAQRGSCTGPEQAMRLLLELLGLERQGRQREVVQGRKTLRDCWPALYAAYMKTR